MMSQIVKAGVKGVIPTTEGSEPFFINDAEANPLSCGIMVGGDSCSVNWNINSTQNGSYEFFVIVDSDVPFVIDVNSSKSTIIIGAKGVIPTAYTIGEAFFVNDGEDNPLSCGNMVDGDSCSVDWNVNGTVAGDWVVYATADSDLGFVSSIDTPRTNITVSLISTSFKVSLPSVYTKISFSPSHFNDKNVSALGQSDGNSILTIENQGNTDLDIYFRLLTALPLAIKTFTSEDFDLNTTQIVLSTAYQLIKGGVVPLANQDIYLFSNFTEATPQSINRTMRVDVNAST